MPDVLGEVRPDGVGVITFNRPERLNAITGRTCEQIAAEIRRVGADSGCRAVVITGAGRGFCAGMDLRDGVAVEDPDPARAAYRGMRLAVDVVLALREIRQPVIAAVNGVAVGAGFAFAAAADFRYCGPSARFIAPFVDLNVSAGDLGLSWMLPRLLGPGAAAELFFTAGTLGAEDAVSSGFVQRLVDDPLDDAIARAAEIATKPPLGVEMTKELLDASIRGVGYREHLEAELRAQVVGLTSSAHAEAVEEFGRR